MRDDDDRKYAFPEAFLVRRRACGVKEIVGVRYRWNTGETQVAWCNETHPDSDIFEEDAIRPPSPQQRASARWRPR